MVVADNLVTAFAGTAVQPAEIMELTGQPFPNEAKVLQFEGASERRMRRDVPVFGTALGATEEIEGEAIEQTELHTADVISYLPRPVILENRPDIYGLYTQGSSMAPRFDQGETLFVDGKRPPRVGDDVVLYLRDGEDDGERIVACLVKRLVKQTGAFVELEQFNPPHTFKIERSRIAKLHRIIPYSELLS